MSAKPQIVKLCEMQPGQLGDFFALLCERNLRNTKAGKPYFSLQFRDSGRSVNSPIWSDSNLFEACNSEWKIGQHFKIRGVFKEHEQYGSQIEIHNIRQVEASDWVDGYNPDEFVQSTKFDIDSMFDELLQAAKAIDDPGLSKLTVNLLEGHKKEICTHPAATFNHHAFRGGYLEHTLSVVRTGMYLADKYSEYYPNLEPPLNRGLIVAGCILHDIGKLVELSTENELIRYTVPGNLIGHILIGRDMVRDAARSVRELDAELLLLLEHIIVSHQGTAEWGSPRPPMFPEALLVHVADDLDAKFNMMVNIMAANETDDAFTDQRNALGRKLLKGRKA